jgi:hypothetical protein
MKVAETALMATGRHVWFGNGRQNGQIINHHFYKCPNCFLFATRRSSFYEELEFSSRHFGVTLGNNSLLLRILSRCTVIRVQTKVNVL